MPTLLTCRSISKSFNARLLFEGLSLTLADEDRVGLIGPNGAGKTTLLKIMAGLEEPDDGEVNLRRSIRVGYVPQEEDFGAGATAARVLSDALVDLVPEQHERETQVHISLAKYGFSDGEAAVVELSGGWAKRLALARELVRRPDLLLLDEPTNHLDMDGILWLESLLSSAPFAFLVVTHDRLLLERVTQRVVEVNAAYSGGCYSVDGPYSMFITKRAEFLEGQLATQKTLANRVRREVEWVKMGRKAQRIKDKARVGEAGRLVAELGELKARNTRLAAPQIDLDATGRKTKNLLVASGLSKQFGGRLLFKDVSLVLSPGTCLGLLGPNGSGKSTLIRILSGALPADEGAIKYADDVRIVVFDQQREALPRTLSLKEALSGDADSVTFRGQAVHVTGWAKRFLFRPDQLNMEVGDLSGGEHARIHIARLMLQPADVLILDEPTNDLDIPTLDLLEENLEQFPGAIVLVTHDRFLLDRLSTEILALDGEGGAHVYADLSQWEASRAPVRSAKPADKIKARKAAKTPGSDPNRLTYYEKQELEGMEAAILAAEQERDARRQALEGADAATDHVESQKRWESLQTAEANVEALYARWQELEGKAK